MFLIFDIQIVMVDLWRAVASSNMFSVLVCGERKFFLDSSCFKPRSWEDPLGSISGCWLAHDFVIETQRERVFPGF